MKMRTANLAQLSAPCMHQSRNTLERVRMATFCSEGWDVPRGYSSASQFTTAIHVFWKGWDEPIILFLSDRKSVSLWASNSAGRSLCTTVGDGGVKFTRARGRARRLG